MAVVTKDFTIYRNGQTTKVRRFSETGTADTALTMTCNPGVPAKLLWAANEMSDDGVDTVTVALDSGVGAAYDIDLTTFNSETLYLPGDDFIIAEDDALTFTVGAGGVGVTAQMQAYFEILEAI